MAKSDIHHLVATEIVEHINGGACMEIYKACVNFQTAANEAAAKGTPLDAVAELPKYLRRPLVEQVAVGLRRRKPAEP